MSKWIGLGALLLAPWCLSGCLWLSGTTAAIIASSESSGGNGSTLTNLTVQPSPVRTQETATSTPTSPCGASPPPEDAAWREGEVEFQVDATGKSGDYSVAFFYIDDVGKHPLSAVVMLNGQRSGAPVHRYTFHLDGSVTQPDGNVTSRSQRFAWDSQGAIKEPKQVAIVARSRGVSTSSRSFWVDNSRIGSVSINDGVRLNQSVVNEKYVSIVTVPLTFNEFDTSLEPRAVVRLHVLGNDVGSASVVELPQTSFEIEPSGSEYELRWSSHVDLPDAHALVYLEIALSDGTKHGDFARTKCFYVDNREPRVVDIQPDTAARDAPFTLRVSGYGLCWPGGGPDTATQLSLTALPDSMPNSWIVPSSADPSKPTNNLANREKRCDCAEDLEADLFGPLILTFSIGSEALGKFGLTDHQGAVTVHLRNPNQRGDRLDSGLSLGLSQLSPVGPRYLLNGTPRKVVLGNFAPDLHKSVADPRAAVLSSGDPIWVDRARQARDAAVIYEDSNFVTILGGDGNGFFPDHWVVPLSSQETRPLAIVLVPSLSGGCDGLLVATETTIELIGCGTGQRGTFTSTPISEDLLFEPETRDIALADFDGDGTDDIAVSGRVSSRVQILIGKKNGNDWTWKLDSSFNLGVSLPRSITAANFDADARGLADLVVLGDREGVDTLFLQRNDSFSFHPEPDALLPVSEGAVEVESTPDGRFNEDDDYPDVIVVRSVGVARILVINERDEEKDEDKWRLFAFPRPTGTATDTPTAAALIHLPAGVVRKDKPLWDLVSVDTEVLAFAYAELDGVQTGEKSEYRLPGPGKALAIGDVNGDGVDDVAVVTVKPSLFQMFLGRAACQDVNCDDNRKTELQLDPFVVPAGRLDGENPAFYPKGLGLKVGIHQGRTFIAVATRLREEVTVAWLKPGTTEVESLEHHTNLGLQLRSLAVANFDLDDPDDEIAVSVQTEDSITLLDPGSGSRKEIVAPLDLRQEYLAHFPSEISIPADEEFNTAKMNTAQLNGTGPPEIFMGVFLERKEVQQKNDFVLVVVDPGSSDQQLQFYRTLDDPRHCVAANINGDAAPDLVIACEGTNSDTGNSVQILFGDPLRTGGRLFFEEESSPENRPRGWIAPLQLPGFPAPVTEGQVEVVITDSVAVSTVVNPSGLTLASFIIASNSPLVIAYRLSLVKPFAGLDCVLPGYPKSHDAHVPAGRLFVDCPQKILEDGGDPEDLALADFYPDNENRLDLVVADEDKHTVELLELLDSAKGNWLHHATFPLGTPYGVTALITEGHPVSIVVGSRLERKIVFYEREESCTQTDRCFYERTHAQSLAEPQRTGTVTSFAAVPAGEMGILTAAVVEDGDVLDLKPRVDVTLIPAGLDAKELAFLGDPDGRARSQSITLPEGAPVPDGVLLTDLASPDGNQPDGFPDLLLHEPQTGTVSILPLSSSLKTEPESQGGGATPIEGLQLDGALVDWELLAADGRTILLAASASEVRAVDLLAPPPPMERLVTTIQGNSTLRQISHGWQGKERNNIAGAFLVLLEDRDVLVARMDGTMPRSLFPGTGGAEAHNILLRTAGAADLNGDNFDDIVVVDRLSSSLLVFLGLDSSSLEFEPVRTFPFPDQLEPVQLAFLDFNGDTVRDVAFGARDGTVLLFAGEGAGKFGGAEAVFAGPELENLYAYDFDRDQRDEIIAAVGAPGVVVLSNREPVSAEGDGK